MVDDDNGVDDCVVCAIGVPKSSDVAYVVALMPSTICDVECSRESIEGYHNLSMLCTLVTRIT